MNDRLIHSRGFFFSLLLISRLQRRYCANHAGFVETRCTRLHPICTRSAPDLHSEPTIKELIPHI